jgi:hypothetical protein
MIGILSVLFGMVLGCVGTLLFKDKVVALIKQRMANLITK